MIIDLTEKASPASELHVQIDLFKGMSRRNDDSENIYNY